jgi:hypothetical protein
MLHLLSGLITYLDKKLQPCDPSLQLVEGVLAVGAKKDTNPITGFVDHPIIDSKLKLGGIFDHSEFNFSDKKSSHPRNQTHNITLRPHHYSS